MALLAKICVVMAALYALAWIGSYFLQRRLTYFPDPIRTAPEDVGLPHVEERFIDTADGAKVLAWWGRAKPGQPTLLYFHGNAGSLADRSERVTRYLNRGFGVFIMTYRGYGGSTGAPSERRNVADAKLAYETIVGAGVRPEDIILYGESLGTGIAVQVAAEKSVAGIILDAPYTSLVDVAEVHYPHLPSRAFMTDRYETTRYLSRVKAPLLIVHGREDRIVPVSMGQRVFDLAPQPKQIAILAGAGHSDHNAFGSGDVISDWIARLRRGQIDPSANAAAE